MKDLPDRIIPPLVEDVEEMLVNRMLLQDLLALLSDKDRDTILLWAHGYSLADIARYVNEKYERRPSKMPLSASGIGPRIRKILKKLRKYAKEG